LTDYMQQQLALNGVRLDAIEYCPHLPDAAVTRYRMECDCRKPRAGMLERAISRLTVDRARSMLVGDRASDILAGREAHVAHCYLVRSGHPLTPDDERIADAVYDDLAACVAATFERSAAAAAAGALSSDS